jgi:pectate lyase
MNVSARVGLQRRVRRHLLVGSVALFFTSFDYASAALPVFPGAEGFGTTTTGGRGGSVCVVTTTAGSGAGSFRSCMMSTGPRIVVFRVSGVIDLEGTNIQLNESNSYVTVLGQSSPGGITIVNGSINNYHTALHDVVIRFIKIRAKGGDTISFNPITNLVLDHVDLSGSSDEVLDLDQALNVTVQWSTYTNSDTLHGQAYGALIAYTPNTNITFHHNFSAHLVNRCGAQFHWNDGSLSAPLPAGGINFELSNNVIYNCDFQQIYRADGLPPEGGNWNLIGNYVKAGPDTPAGAMIYSLDGKVYETGSVYAGGAMVWSIYVNPTFLSQRHPFPLVTTTSSAQAFEDVLAFVGSWPRDAMTTRTVNEARMGTGTLGKLDDPLNTATGPAPASDGDKDGIPDAWETSHGLNANDSGDSARLHASGYANIEVYLNEVADQLTQRVRPSPPTQVTAQ